MSGGGVSEPVVTEAVEGYRDLIAFSPCCNKPLRTTAEAAARPHRLSCGTRRPRDRHDYVVTSFRDENRTVRARWVRVET